MTRFLAWPVLLFCLSTFTSATEFHVAPGGDDDGPGSADCPFATLARARNAVRAVKGKATDPIDVILHEGTYYLPETFVLTAKDSGTDAAPVTYRAGQGAVAVISGGERLRLHWEPYKDGIMKAKTPAGFTTDQLFVNGRREPMARYPNYDPSAQYFGGTAADCISRDRAARWADPRGGFFHAMHRAHWGDMHFLITGKDAQGNVTYVGGWQNNRPSRPHREHRFVENIFEELDAPGEWYFSRKEGVLYCYPPEGVDLSRATIETARLRHLVEFRGAEAAPVRHVTLQGLVFTHTARTFMENKEPLLRSDWTTYRGGAVFFDGAEDCALVDCDLLQVGGNAVFVNRYNRRIAIRGCKVENAGASSIAFVGDPGAVRSAKFQYSQRNTFEELDLVPGPKTNNYPADCLVEDCLLVRNGRFEKQTAGVQISMSARITVRHCSIYDCPRAGVNICDGTWGGHVIEYCDVFDTVKETSDHGSFNSWGRDRFWGLEGFDLNTVTLGEHKDLPKLDTVETVVLHDNRWRCDHGWDIDLDDGSSNYHLYNNLCLHGGIKNREGFYRVVENNIMVDNAFHPHVWYRNSRDVFRRNIVFTRHGPIRVGKPWGKQCDYNLLHDPTRSGPATELQEQTGRDRHSIVGDAKFVDPASGDYRVREDSPALALGFESFDMEKFGVVSPRLRAEARTPKLPAASRATRR